MTIDIKNVSVLGLGKLGFSMMCGFASRGFQVTGFDLNPEMGNQVRSGHTPIIEPYTQEYLDRHSENMSIVDDHVSLVEASDITFVVVPTPSLESGRFELEYARKAFEDLGKALRSIDKFHVFVLTSTVLPGDSREEIIPAMERASGKVCGVDFGFCYNPEFIALGTVIRDFLNPDFYLLGEFDEKSGDYLKDVHNKTALNGAAVKRMTIENAEIAKISVNSFVTLKVSFANMLAQICQHTENSNVDVVSDALGMDSRIGRKYLTGGLNFAGPCFPRDNRALAASKTSKSVDTSLLKANDDFNNRLSNWVVENMREHLHGDKIGVLGLSYKPLSHITEQAPGVGISRTLANDFGKSVFAFDPIVNENNWIEDQEIITFCSGVDELLDTVDTVIIANVHEEFQAVAKYHNKPLKVIDCWRVLDPSAISSSINLVRYGVGKELP